MRPSATNLFGFRLLAYEPTSIQPKIGVEPTAAGLSKVIREFGHPETISRVSAKIGGTEPLG